ncbi:MAG TPA: alpha/beta hydrolase [Pyrinomonadaceae bacterium]|jgi:pimeloyl-ACP methyl ester carboxylesterase
MSPRRRPGRRLAKAFLPIALLLLLAAVGTAVWLVRGAAHPPQRPYLVTPEKFEVLSHRGLKVTEETWTNRDGTQGRGWLLRGAEGSPAVVLLHRYGADRSWLLNLGVKLNEATGFTVLWPDLRGHGLSPPVSTSTFGSLEAEDVLAALEHLRRLKTQQDRPLLGNRVGLYGVELGAYAALDAAARDSQVRALVLDSVPASPDELLRSTIKTSTGLDNGLVHSLASTGMRLYSLGDYEDAPACAFASQLKDRQALLLAGEDARHLRPSTVALARCFPDQFKVETLSDLPLTGFTLASAPGEQGELYDRRVIDFFDRALQPQ